MRCWYSAWFYVPFVNTEHLPLQTSVHGPALCRIEDVMFVKEEEPVKDNKEA